MPDEEKQTKLKILYARLKGLGEYSTTREFSFPKNAADDFNQIVDEVGPLLDQRFDNLKITHFKNTYPDEDIVEAEQFNLKVLQLLRILEYGYNLNDNIMEIGSLYNSITDKVLKERCSDILTAPGNFDRVINQATTVLEDRIRSKSNLMDLIGVDLVNRAINPEPSKSILVINGSKEEHEGLHYICKGIMLAFRNPTHHKITDKYRREDALKVCAFIDNILSVLEGAKLK
jgi:hypothetical protein